MAKYYNLLYFAVLACFVFCLVSTPCPCEGKVAYQVLVPNNPSITLDPSALQVLADGKQYENLKQNGRTVEAVVVQDVHAVPRSVWDILLDFNSYSTRIPAVQTSKNYFLEERTKQQHTRKKQLQQLMYTQMKIKILLFNFNIFVRHEIFEDSMKLTWTLDTANKSDLQNLDGMWHVTPHPTNSNWSRVYYSVTVSFCDWVPTIILQLLKKPCLRMATSWIKVYSELLAAGPDPQTYCTWTENGQQCSPNEMTSRRAAIPNGNTLLLEQPAVGIRRYILVGLVLLLVLANLYLCLERMAT